MIKNKWLGTCRMCGGKELKLATTQTNLSPVMRYWILRCCDHCQQVMRYQIDHTMAILQADRQQLEGLNKE